MSELNMMELLSIDGLQGIGGEVATVEPLELTHVTSNPTERQEDLADDYTNARNSINIASQLAMELAISATETARTAESPRSIEVAQQAINTLASIAKEQLKLHDSMKNITSEQTKVGTGSSPVAATQTITTQNVFVGTPSELMAQMGTQYESQKNEKIIEGEVL